jgi:hypothetical protein
MYYLIERDKRIFLTPDKKDSDEVLQSYVAGNWMEAREQIEVNDFGGAKVNGIHIYHQPGYGFRRSSR